MDPKVPLEDHKDTGGKNVNLVCFYDGVEEKTKGQNGHLKSCICLRHSLADDGEEAEPADGVKKGLSLESLGVHKLSQVQPLEFHRLLSSSNLVLTIS